MQIFGLNVPFLKTTRFELSKNEKRLNFFLKQKTIVLEKNFANGSEFYNN